MASSPVRPTIMRSVLRLSLRVASVTLFLVLAVAGVVYALSERRLHARFDVPTHPFVVRADSASIAEGGRLATVKGCVDCHGARLTGNTIIDDPLVGRLAGPNLSRGGRGATLTDADWERAVRHGVRRDGSSLTVMPSGEFSGMSDADLSAIVAYVRSLPADTTPTVPVRAGPMIRTLFVAGQVNLASAADVDHTRPHPASVVAEPTPAFGKYLAQGCTGCHGPGFAGGKVPGTPPDWKPAANITPEGIGHYTEEDFVRVLREGKRPDGTPVDTLMPYRLTRHMTDVELRALYSYLRTVPAKPYGTR
jgi:mono/diheme cytochrome c family protein